MKRINTVRAFCLLLVVAGFLLFASGGVAQKPAPAKSPQTAPQTPSHNPPQPTNSPEPSPTPEPDKSRSRRVSPDSPGSSAETSNTNIGEKPSKDPGAKTKPALGDETKPAPGDETKPAPGDETKPAPGAKTKPAPGAETKPAPGAETKPAPGAETKPAPGDETKPAPSDEITALRDEIDAAPNEQERARLRLKLADQLAKAGLKEDAIAELRSMGSEDRFDPQNFYNVGNALARLGDTEGAIENYRKATIQRKGRYSRAFNNLGVVLMRQGRWDESYEALMSALRLENFRYAEASYNLGRLYAARGQNDLATLEWRRALAVNPDHTASSQALSRIGGSGNIRIASATTKRDTRPPEIDKPTTPTVIKSAPRPVPRQPLALTVDPETFAFLQKARTARERSRIEEAVENYRRVIDRMGGYFAPANLELAYSLIALRRNDEAVEVLLPVSHKDGERFPVSYYHLGRLYEAKAELKLAEENYSRAAEAYNDTNAQFLLDLSRVRERLNNFTGALASLEHYVTSFERQGLKPPDWCAEKLANLKKKLAASQTQPKP